MGRRGQRAPGPHVDTHVKHTHIPKHLGTEIATQILRYANAWVCAGVHRGVHWNMHTSRQSHMPLQRHAQTCSHIQPQRDTYVHAHTPTDV